MNYKHSFNPNVPPTSNLVDRLQHWKEQRGSQPAFYFLHDSKQLQQVTYSELDRQARAIAATLKKEGHAGERALLLYPPGLDFVAAFFGCLYAGTTAVPALPPRRNNNMARVEAISDDAQATVVLSVQNVIERSQIVVDDERSSMRDVPWLATEEISIQLADDWRSSETVDNPIAVLQYTSGSTGQPKGVMLTHANLMHNCSLITFGFEADQTSLGLSWLPTYHDMGLVGGILNPMYVGRPNVLMSPMSFLQKPIRWLRAISDLGITISGGPNFAYSLCNEKISNNDCDGLDLSSWKVAYNGAEPIRAETLTRFTEKFKPFGFRAETHYPCYGMAESTLIVTGIQRQEPPLVCSVDSDALEENRVVPVAAGRNSARQLVGSGRVLPGQEVMIVDPESCVQLPNDQVGEIWVSSHSVALGYWNNEQETRRVFSGHIANNGSRRFLRTGDLGFFHADQLFVTGRTKDLIIIHGRNLYPQDIELIAENAHQATRIGGAAAFSIDIEDSEHLVIAQELQRGYRNFDTDEITAAIRQAVLESLDVMPHTIVLLSTGKLPKTSSGKVRRHECRTKFLSNQLIELARWHVGIGTESSTVQCESSIDERPAPATGCREDAIETWLMHSIARRLQITPESIDVNASFAALGLDSVTLMGLSGELQDYLGIAISPKLLFNYPTISEISSQLARLEIASQVSVERDATDGQQCVQLEKSAIAKGLPIENEFSADIDEMSESEIDNALSGMLNLDLESKRKLLVKMMQHGFGLQPTSHPMSQGQRALWFVYQLDRNNPAYNIMCAATVNAEFNQAAFCRAFESLVDRHEILRTTYSMRNGQPVCNVHPRSEWKLQTVDATDWTRDRLEAEIQTAADTPFDLERGPIIRVQLFERCDGRHVVLFAAHHIALDSWSFDVLFEELEMLYRAHVDNRAANLPRAVAYSQFVAQQEQFLNSEEGNRQWEYWRKELEGELPSLKLPTDHPRPPLQTFRGKTLQLDLPDTLTRRLRDISRSHDATPFTTLLTAFQVLLFRYSGQQEVLVGVPTAGRNLTEFANVLGYFANPIVLRTIINADESFSNLLKRVRRSLVDGMLNQDYPFAKLVERKQPRREPSRSPVFQVAIGWEKIPTPQSDAQNHGQTNGKAVDAGKLDLEPFAFGQQGSAFDLTLTALDADNSLSLKCQYNRDLFEASTIGRMVTHLQTLLEAIADNPDQSLAGLELMNEYEKKKVLEDWNKTASDFAADSCIHERFESQARLSANAIAVQFQDQQLTYQELNERANQLANHLVCAGVGPDSIIGIYIDRSLELLVGMLGVLKAGGGFVPLSAGTPKNRLELILHEIQSPIVLTMQDLAGDVPNSCHQVLCLDSDWHTVAEHSNSNLDRRAGPSNLAYVIFTSGSSGQPKGVEIEHRSVVNFLTTMQERPGISSDDVLLAVTTHTFDISILELLLPLTVGAKTVIVSTCIAADGIQLAKAIGDANATIMQATPATWRMLLEAGWAGSPKMKTLCGGETLPPDLANQLIERCESLWNLYGPTETTIWSTIEKVEQRSERIPIGRPIANTQIYILDQQLQPVPYGVTGSIYIGGEGLARGYLNQPELTAEKFVANPFCKDEQARLYRTGDLGRLLPNGKIEFLEREDFQIKIRGFRVEPGEIEARLNKHPSIRQAVVVARECGGQLDDKQLVAYFTHGETPNTSELRSYLKQDLPDYMLPAVFVPLNEFPLNNSGKTDRNALPAPASTRPNLMATYVAPRNAMEQTLAEIWTSVLRLDSVGVQDNFFELGGASIQSLEIAAQANKAGIAILPATLFQYPTIEELAKNQLLENQEPSIGQQQSAGTDSESNSISPNLATIKTRIKSLNTNSTAANRSNIIIESIGVYLPDKSVTTDEVIAGCKNKIWFPLEEMTGIQSRRVAADNEFTSDLACKAVVECLNHSKFNQDQVDLVICCHIGRDEAPHSAAIEPGTSMYLKHRMGFANAVAFDISNACAGMFTGISIAESYIRTGAARNAIVVSAEHLSPVTATAQQEISDFMDPRIACLTLGDAGAAVLLTASSTVDGGFHELEMYSLSKYSLMCVGRPTDQQHGGPILTVPDPIKHTTIAIENSIAHSKHVLDRSSWNPDGIQHIIMHQTSERSLSDGARAINEAFNHNICNQENTVNNLATRGNTASTSHFVAVWDNILNGRINTGDRVVFAITGSGQTIGTGTYCFDNLPDRIRNRRERPPMEEAEPVEVLLPLQPPQCRHRIRTASVGTVPKNPKVPVETIPMVVAAVEDCLSKSSYDRSEIDLVLFAGVYRTDFISEPALAAIIAGELGINVQVGPSGDNRTFAFDVVNGGLGFLNSCDIAAQMIRSGKIRTALVVASDIENNREAYPDKLLGLRETASAIILDQSNDTEIGFGQFVFEYLPEKLTSRIVTGKYMPGQPMVCLEQDPDIAQLFLGVIPKAVDELLHREGLSLSDISIVLPPQFSGEFLDHLSLELAFPRDRMVDLTGDGKDLLSSALPYSMHQIESRSLVESGDIGLVINIGAGLQIGCATYYF